MSFSFKKHADRPDIFKESLLNVKEHFLKLKDRFLKMKDGFLEIKKRFLRVKNVLLHIKDVVIEIPQCFSLYKSFERLIVELFDCLSKKTDKIFAYDQKLYLSLQ